MRPNNHPALAFRARLLAECLDLFGLLVVQRRQTFFRPALRPQQFVELGVNGLRVAMFRPLDEERHQQRRDARSSLPVEGFPVEDHPQRRVDGHRRDRPWPGQPYPGSGQEAIELRAHLEENETMAQTVPLSSWRRNEQR